MKINDLGGDAAELIQALKVRTIPEPNFSEICNEYDPKRHEIYDTAKRPNKDVMEDNEDGKSVVKRIEYVARIALSLQKIIVKRAVAFTFGNPVKIDSEVDNDTQQKVLDAVKRILSDNKDYAINRRLARAVFTYTEAAECWFPVPAPEGFDDYGFPSKTKLRCMLFSAKAGDKLYPLFDKTGDMIAFSREFKVREDGKDVTYFETYTDEEKAIWRQGGAGWEEVTREPNPIKKIPVIYAHQEQTEWSDVQPLIDRLEKLLSNFADTNDYHAAPKIFVRGKLIGFSRKGDSGAILEGENDKTDAKYLAWEHAPESVKLEVETMLRMIYTLTQTPDISFDSVKGLSDVSGIALKLLFLDAHLKVKDKEEIFIEYLQRRYNVLKAYVGEMNTTLKAEAGNLVMTPEIVPYMIDDEATAIQNLTSATGGKPIVSQKTAVRLAGLVDDVDAEYEQIQEERSRENTFNAFESTV